MEDIQALPKVKSFCTPNNLKHANAQCNYLYVRNNLSVLMDFEIGVFFPQSYRNFFGHVSFSRENKNILGKLKYLLTASQSSVYSFSQNVLRSGNILLIFTVGK